MGWGLDAWRELGGGSMPRGPPRLRPPKVTPSCFASYPVMPPIFCSKVGCAFRLQKGKKYKTKNGSFVCKGCYKEESAQAVQALEVEALKKTLDAKLKSADKAVQAEKKRRHVLERQITDRLLASGEYMLEGKDAKLVPNGVIAHRLEEAKEMKEKAWSRAAAMSSKLHEERRLAKARDRERRNELADKTDELLVSRQLISELRKVAKHSDRKAVSCTQKAAKAGEMLKEAKRGEAKAIAALSKARARRKLYLQQARRARKDEGGGAVEKMMRCMSAIEGECAKLEEELEVTLEKVVTLERELKEKAVLISHLWDQVERPHPVVDFGEKGDKYSAKAFRLGCKLLNCKLTCQSAADVVEVIYGEVYPHYKGRLPSREQFETWRKELYVFCRWAVTDCLQNKCEYLHICSDASTKGKSVASRKTQIHLTGGVGVLKEEFGGGKFSFNLGFDIIPDGKSETEGNSSLEMLHFNAGPNVSMSRSVSTGKLVSITTDSAPAAMASSDIILKRKQDEIGAIAPEDLAAMTIRDQELAKRPCKKRRCQNHLFSFLCQHFVGQKATKKKKVDANPDKEKADHGQVVFWTCFRVPNVEIPTKLCVRVRWSTAS